MRIICHSVSVTNFVIFCGYHSVVFITLPIPINNMESAMESELKTCTYTNHVYQ